MLAAFLVPNCVLSCQSAELWVQAESLGQSELERLRAQPFPPTAPSPRSETVGGHAYRVRTELLPEPECTAAEARRVRVTVSWHWRTRELSWCREGTLHAGL